MTDPGCLYSIKTKYKIMSDKEKKIADFILANPREAVHPSIEELAGQIGISESTLFRFVKKLGYSGYQRFRIALATEAVSPASRFFETTINENDDEVEIVFNSAISTLELSKATLDREAMARAAERIISSERLLLFGIGGSNIVARDAFHKFIRTGLICTMAEDYHIQLMLASQATPETAALIISHTGENMDCLAIAEELSQKGSHIIILTSNPLSPLAKTGHTVLTVQVASTSFVSEAFSARIAHLLVIDALYVEIMKRLNTRGVARLEDMRRIIAKRRT